MIVEPADPNSAEAQAMYDAYVAEITATFGYDTTRTVPSSPADYVPPAGRLLVVRDADGAAVGCGAVRLLDAETAEVKRMWLHPATRGKGAGRMLLAALEAEAVALGASRGVLDTNSSLASALALYRAAGWDEVAAYNDNPQATHWFAKPLA